MNKTKIEWVKNPDGTQGYTWNPITGCLNGCEYCYARKLANGRLRSRYLANINGISPYERDGKHLIIYPSDDKLNDPFYPRFWPEKVNEMKPMARWAGGSYHRKRKGIFVCDMGELFGDWVPREWQDGIFKAIRSQPSHRFYLLTKQPQNLLKFSPFPDHCYVGVTATGNKMADIAQRYMLKIEATIKYLSIEPFLEHIQWEFILGYNQVIIGACTGTELEMRALAHQTNREVGYVLPYGQRWTLQPKIEWVQEIVLVCTKAHLPLFLKDNLKPLLPNRMPFYAVYSYWSQDRTHQLYENRLRQEMPK